MNLAIFKILDKDTIRKILLSLFFFTLPNYISIHNIILGFIILYWIICEDKKDFFILIKSNPFILFIYIFIGILTLSLLWSSNIKWGLHILSKEIVLLIIPILMSIIKKQEIDYFMKVFIVSMTLSEIISYSIKFQILPPMFHATPYDPAIFMGHISYTPYLAFTIYLLLYFLFTSKEKPFIKILSIFFVITMSINLFITGGRAGQVAFFILIVLAIFQFLKFNIKTILFTIIIIPLIFIIAYNSSRIFHNRVNLAIYNIIHFKQNPNTSVGLRIIFVKNSLRIIKSHPILGVGIGDFPSEYNKISNKYTPNITTTSQPHNMYVFIFAESGIFAFLIFIIMFLIIFISAIKINDKYKPIKIAFVLLFLVIMWSDTYLLGYFTTQLFIGFSSLLFRNISWNILKKESNGY